MPCSNRREIDSQVGGTSGQRESDCSSGTKRFRLAPNAVVSAAPRADVKARQIDGEFDRNEGRRCLTDCGN